MRNRPARLHSRCSALMPAAAAMRTLSQSRSTRQPERSLTQMKAQGVKLLTEADESAAGQHV